MAHTLEFRLEVDKARFYNNRFDVCVHKDGRITHSILDGKIAKMRTSQEYFDKMKNYILYAYDPVTCTVRGLTFEEEFEWNEYLIVIFSNIFKSRTECCAFRADKGVMQHCRILTSIANILTGDYNFVSIIGNEYFGLDITKTSSKIESPFEPHKIISRYRVVLEQCILRYEEEYGNITMDNCLDEQPLITTDGTITTTDNTISSTDINQKRVKIDRLLIVHGTDREKIIEILRDYAKDFIERMRTSRDAFRPGEEEMVQDYEILVDELRILGYIPKNEFPLAFVPFKQTNTKSARV